MERKLLGLKGEELAKDYFVGNGFKILEQNYRYGRAEIDIICEKNNKVIFCEVKTRSVPTISEITDQISPRKEELYYETATHYLDQHEIDKELQFDLVSIAYNGYSSHLEHYPDAFYSLP